MKKCVFCEMEFEELSCEHIIPNVVCGRLKSNELLCSKCNNELGNTIDKFLDGKFATIVNLFGFKRERGTPPPASAELVSGRPCEILHGGKPVGTNVQIDMSEDSDGNILMHLNAPENNNKLLSNEVSKFVAKNKDIFTQHGVDYKKAIPNIIKNVSEKIKNNEVEHQQNHERVHCKFDFGGKDFYRALLKILYLFLLHNYKNVSANRKNIKQMIISGDNICDIFYYCFDPENLFKYQHASVYNSISIKSFRNEKILLGFIDLLGISPYICVLDDNYEGEDILASYGYDLLSEKEVMPELTFSETSFPLKDRYDFHKTTKERLSHCKNKFSHLMQIYELLSVPERIGQDFAGSNFDSSILDFLSNYLTRIKEYIIANLDKLLPLKSEGCVKLHNIILHALLETIQDTRC